MKIRYVSLIFSSAFTAGALCVCLVFGSPGNSRQELIEKLAENYSFKLLQYKDMIDMLDVEFQYAEHIADPKDDNGMPLSIHNYIYTNELACPIIGILTYAQHSSAQQGCYFEYLYGDDVKKEIESFLSDYNNYANDAWNKMQD
ncbi:MAG: hypothetical protein A2Y14_00205 [Verrucomicrobia bacterium GWF2_51_19]|nr:MAG: hypothetical protein A2Y14_00205 [Verrucomicrobia bacterium GWF2_51_19]HCJ11667.1 hypothetical protein [Opitutae bacterium]